MKLNNSNYEVIVYDRNNNLLSRAYFDTFPDVRLWIDLWQDFVVKIWLLDDDGPVELK